VRGPKPGSRGWARLQLGGAGVGQPADRTAKPQRTPAYQRWEHPVAYQPADSRRRCAERCIEQRLFDCPHPLLKFRRPWLPNSLRPKSNVANPLSQPQRIASEEEKMVGAQWPGRRLGGPELVDDGRSEGEDCSCDGNASGVGEQNEPPLGRDHVAPEVFEEIARLDGGSKTTPGPHMQAVEGERQVFTRIRMSQRQPGTLAFPMFR
jgi:hypothetical protein